MFVSGGLKHEMKNRTLLLSSPKKNSFFDRKKKYKSHMVEEIPKLIAYEP
jgi:hypothetical protein